ncbi:hypothetical protein HDE_03668 [Halotydeus destructor]|nr:hypothetical protein HDE_03668 [Halotydeus destructor]
MSSELRVSYSRVYGYLNQDYEFIPQELDANVTIVNKETPILGSYSIFVNYLADVLSKRNITIRLIRPEIADVGSMDEKGKYNGIIGLIQDGSADVAAMPIGTSIGNVVDFTSSFMQQPGYLIQDITLSGDEQHHKVDFLKQTLSVYNSETMMVIFFVFSVALLIIKLVGKHAKDVSKSRMRKVTMFELFRMFMNQHDTVLANYKQRAVYMGSALAMMFIMWVIVNSIGTKQVMPGRKIISTLEELYNESEQDTVIQWSLEGYTTTKFFDRRHPLLRKLYTKFNLQRSGIRMLDFKTYTHKRGTFILEELSVLNILRRIICGMTCNDEEGLADKHVMHRITQLDETFAHAIRKNLSLDFRNVIVMATTKITEHGFTNKMYDLGVLWNDFFKACWSYCSVIDTVEDFIGVSRSISYEDFVILSKTVVVILFVAVISLFLEVNKQRNSSKKSKKRRRRHLGRRKTRPILSMVHEDTHVTAYELYLIQNIQLVHLHPGYQGHFPLIQTVDSTAVIRYKPLHATASKLDHHMLKATQCDQNRNPVPDYQ